MKKTFFTLICALLATTLSAQNSQWQTFDTQKQAISATRLITQKSSLGLALSDDLTQINVSGDDLGYKHYRYQQTHQNYPVEGAQLLVHENQYGLVYAVNGGLVHGISQSTDVTLSEQAALDKALQHSKGKTFAWQDSNYQKALQEATENPAATFYPKGELVWVSNSAKQEPQSYKLSYKFDVFSTQPLSRKFIFVDVQTGNIITEHNQLHDADAPCTGTAQYSCSNPVSITADNQTTYYRLRENIARKIETYTANNGTDYAFFDITSTDNNFNEDPTATAVHWSTEKTYDYFKNTHNRNSFDGTNGKLMSWVHFDNGFDNAFWNGSWMTYGDGSTFSPLVSTDVVGHEITHGITQYSANLTYSYEPGALNESFSDIFGTVVEFYADPSCFDWKIGEDLTANYNGGQGIRNMQNPNLHGQPDTYLGTYWYTGNGDNGGVHYNSGVQNHWFYLLCQGGSGTNDLGTAYNVTAIGMTKAARIVYRMLTVYLTPTSYYSDARQAAISAATDLYGAGSPELTQVVNAWCAVGVGTCSLSSGTITVTSPNGSEVWQAGSTHNLTWTSTGTIPNVAIYYSIDGGTTWNFIANQANTGSRTWTVANSPTTLAQIRITDTSNPSISDDSNANFTIQGCNVLAGFSATANTICVPTTLTFTNTSSGATTYSWSVNGTTQGTSTNLSYDFTTAGTYTVQLTAINGTCSDTYTQTITVNPAPDAAFTHTETGLNFSGFAAQLSANSYLWDFGDGNTSTMQNATHTYTADNNYLICLTVTNGCGTIQTCKNVSVAAQCEDLWTQYTRGIRVAAIAEEGNYLWLGTQGGLIRFDKTTHEQLYYNSANSGLPYDAVTTIAIDAQGYKWIGTYGGGFARFDGANEWVKYNIANNPYPDVPLNPYNPSYPWINCDYIGVIKIDADNNKWIGTLNMGPVKLSATGNFTLYYTNNAGSYYVPDIAIDDNGHKWLAASGGLVETNIDGVTLHTYNTAHGLPSTYLRSIAIDDNGDKWVGIDESGLVKVTGGGGSINVTTTAISTGTILDIAIDHNTDNIWAGYFGGFAKLDANGNILASYPLNAMGLYSSDVQAITIGTDGTKWMGTIGSAFFKLDETNFNNSIIYNTPINPGLGSNDIWSIAIDKNNHTWVGTRYHGLSEFDGTTWHSYSTGFVRALAVDSQNNKWFPYSSGLAKIDNAGNQTNYPNAPGGILAIAIDASDKVWVGTEGAGLAKFDPATSAWTTYTSSSTTGGLPNDIVQAITIDAQGNIWAGTQGGLAKFDGTNWATYTTSNSGLPYNDVRAIDIDSQGNLWIGTYSYYLAKFDGTNWTTYTPGASYIENITIDSDDNIWIGYDVRVGLTKFSDTSNTYTHFNSGLSSGMVRGVAIDPFGNKWIATEGGVSVLGNCTTTNCHYYSKIHGNTGISVGASHFYYDNTEDVFYMTGIKKIDAQTGTLDISNTSTYTPLYNVIKSDANAILGTTSSWTVPEYTVSNLQSDLMTASWHKKISITNSSRYPILSSAKIAADNSLVFSGWRGGSNGDDLGLMRIDNLGNVLWANYYDYSGDDQFNKVINDGADNIVAIGVLGGGAGNMVVSKIDANGNHVNTYSYDYGSGSLDMYTPRNLIKTVDGGYAALVKCVGLPDPNQITIVKLDANLAIQWVKTISYNNQTIDISHDGLIQTSQGDFFISAQIANGTAKVPLVIKLNSNGNYIWAKQLDDNNGALDVLEAVKLQAIGNDVVVLMTTKGTSNVYGTNDLVVDRTDSDFSTLCATDVNVTVNTETWTTSTITPTVGTTTYNITNDAVTITASPLLSQDFCGTTACPCPVVSFTPPTTSTCANTPYTFTNTSTGAVSYEWKVNGIPVSTDTHLTYTFPTSGSYTITLDANNGTCTETYSQTITVNGSATQLNLGDDVMQCGSSSVTLDCGISGALWYNWDLNGTLVGTTQSITATQSGTYHLSVMDACNQGGIDEISVLLDDDCVWPGDVNYDNIVNYLDLLPIGLNYGTSGNIRPNATFAFNAQACQDWSNTQANGETNLKHADCNGNGIIDNNDPAAIQQNYSQTHGIAPANPVNSISPISLSAALGIAPPSFGNSTIIRLDLYANNSQNLNVTAYGIGFDIHYQFPNCIKVNSAYIDFTSSWLGTVGVDMAVVQKNFLNSNLKSGHVEVAMTRLDHQNRNGYGKIGTLIAEVDIYASLNELQAAASMLGQQITMANGTFVPVGGVSGSFNLANPTALPIVSVAANPTTALIGGSCSNTLVSTVSNCSGCTYQWKRNSTIISGATSSVYSPTQTGTYYVIVTASSGLSASASVAVAYNNAIVNTNGTALPFCLPSGINASAEYIKSVQFGTDAANVTGSNNGGYANFTCAKVFNISVNCPATLTLQPKFVSTVQTEYWTVWIDKNMDGDFVDVGEQIWQKVTTNGNPFSKTFAATSIPTSLLGKTFRMRVAMKRGSYATSPCENFANGEVEDYTLRFVPSSCKADAVAEADVPFDTVADMPIRLFPNPVTDWLRINFVSDVEEEMTIRVYDIIGRLVFEEPIWSLIGDNSTQIATQQLSNGMYFLQISGRDKSSIQSFVKQ